MNLALYVVLSFDGLASQLTDEVFSNCLLISEFLFGLCLNTEVFLPEGPTFSQNHDDSL